MLVLGGGLVRSKLVHRRKFHWTVVILLACIVLTFISQCLSMAHYSAFSSDGVGTPGALVAARFVQLACDALFTLLLLLLAKGWTVVRRKISPDGRVKLAAFLALQTGLSAFALIWSEYT